jgi:hypothetical protein
LQRAYNAPKAPFRACATDAGLARLMAMLRTVQGKRIDLLDPGQF